MSSTNNIEEDVVEFEQADLMQVEEEKDIPISRDYIPISRDDIPISRDYILEMLYISLKKMFGEMTLVELISDIDENWENNPLRYEVQINGEVCKQIVLAAQYNDVENKYFVLRLAKKLFIMAIEEGNIPFLQDAMKIMPSIIRDLAPILQFVTTESMLKWFLENGHEINEKGWPNNETALHCAAGLNKIGTIKLLVKYGADIDSKDDYGGTPLNYAIIGEHKEAVEYLLKLGADVNKLRVKRFISCRSRDFAEYLLEKGVNPVGIATPTWPVWYIGAGKALGKGNKDRIRAAKGVDEDFPLPAAATQSQPKTADDMNKKIRATTGLWFK